MADVELITIFNLFPELPEVIQRAVIKATKKAAFMIQKAASEQAPIEFGALKSSIYVEVHSGENKYPYDAAAAEAESRNPDAVMLPEVEKPNSPTVAYIAVGMNYGIYQEMGTVHMPAHPYLVPAAELVMPEYVAALEALEGSLEL